MSVRKTLKAKAKGITFHTATPILRVRSLRPSLDYYVKKLGFKVDWQTPGVIASLSRARCRVFLCEGDQGNPGSWVWIGVSDVEALFKELRLRRAKVRHPPTNYEWALEMQVEDPDGNVLRFGSDPKEGQPVGEWLDMRGTRWARSTSRRWTRVK